MNIYSGPSKAEFDPYGDKHTIVDVFSITKVGAWSGRCFLGPLNLSTEEASKRFTVGYVEIEQGDVIELYKGLIQGLVERTSVLEDALREIVDLPLSNDASQAKSMRNSIIRALHGEFGTFNLIHKS